MAEDTKKGCGTNYAQIDKSDASGTGAVSVNANHIIQYPKQPKRDDGKWLAIASLLGAVLGRYAAKGLINKAKDAEDVWRTINDKMKDIGNKLIDQKAPAEDSLAQAADAWLLEEAMRNNDLAKDHESYASSLEPCNDTIHEQLCAFIKCGYQEDHYGIATRTIADAEAKAKQKRRELHRAVSRYGVNHGCEIETRLALATSAEIVGTVARAREAERQTAWQTNYKLRFEGAELFEKHRLGRVELGLRYGENAIKIQDSRYARHSENYYRLMQLGLDVLASAGKNYAWLADSLRKTAEKDISGLSALASLVALAIGFFICFDSEVTCGIDTSCCGSTSSSKSSRGG